MKAWIYREKGQSLVIVAILLVALIGMLALTLDGGFAYLQRRGAQTAADAGALAGARQLCETGDANLAVDSALNYAIDRNGADEASAYIADGNVTVEAYITFSTFFGRIFSRPEITAAAIAAARCEPAGAAANVLPIAWSCPPDDVIVEDDIWKCGMQYGENEPYIIMQSDRIGEDDCISQGGSIDCDIDGDGVDELKSGGNRSWIYLDTDGGGADALRDWIIDGFPGKLYSHTWFPGKEGVADAIFMSIEFRVGEPVLLPVYNARTEGLPTSPWIHENDLVIENNAYSSTYYHVITFAKFIPTCVRATGADHCAYYDTLRAEGTLVPQDKTVEGYFEPGTWDGVEGGGTWYAGVYAIALTR
jgi:hypothetical protein